MREPIGRGSRDFPPREPPRGPKALIDPPSGPRANYGGDFRGDFGYRGSDFGRGRARGGRGRGWRDDSRDRGRETERDYRGPRDDRGPPPFRDDRSRDRDRWDRNDNFRGRRPSSPQIRARSPNYGAREPRDAPSSLDVDRARRESRDGPLSGGSPSSDSLQSFRGYGRGRGARGRGRGGYYDDFHGRNPSPDPTWSRRAQPSATPPPQVPAFGSTATNLPIPPTAPKGFTTPSTAPPTGPALESISGMPVPTAPRSQRAETKHTHAPRGPTNSTSWVNPDPSIKKEVSKPQLRLRSPSRAHSPSPVSASTPRSSRKGSLDDRKTPFDETVVQEGKPNTIISGKVVAEQPLQKPHTKRRPIIGKRTLPSPKESPRVPEDVSDESDADSVDSIGRGDFFEEDMKKIEDQISRLPKNPEDDPLDFAKMSELSREPLPAPEDSDKLKIWAAELKYHKELRQKKYENELLDLSPFRPKKEPNPPFLEPLIKSRIDQQLIAIHTANLQLAEDSPISKECIPEVPKESALTSIAPNDSSQPKPQSKIRSRATPPRIESEGGKKSTINGQNRISSLESEPSKTHAPSQVPASNVQSLGLSETPAPLVTPAEASSLNLSTAAVKTAVNGSSSKPRSTLEKFEQSEDNQTQEERIKQLQSVRKTMKTPPLSSLPKFNVKRWDEDKDFLKTLEPDLQVEEYLRKKRVETITRRQREQEEEGLKWRDRYYDYRKWTDRSNDPACIRSREKFSKARENAAADVAAIKTFTPAPNAKPEPSRRMGRFATEHDFERVLRESEQEANEAKEREERSARARTASAKEATIPPMSWDEEQWQETAYSDRTGLVSFERSFALLEFGEPLDNFTQEENEIFEKAYMEFPKQWGKIAEALPNRDYKACIQHYYIVKHESNLKEKGKKVGRKRGRAKGQTKGKPKSNVLMADMVGDGDDGQDNENGGERRRPRRAAAPTWNFETPADSEAASPAPTPGRKNAATPKGENGNDAPPPTKRKTKAPREKISKQAKNSQLLAAAPTSATRRPESPTIQTPASRGSNGNNRVPTQFDGVPGPATFAPSQYLPDERNSSGAFANLDSMSQNFPTQERDSATPMSFDAQDRRNPQHTSSYWSVPEQTDFPDLLRHFGTDWHGIAKFMTSKTHIMVKNYYQRHVESGKMAIWEKIAKDADEKKSRGESTGPLPTPTAAPAPKTRGHPGSGSRLGSAMDGIEETQSPSQNVILQQASPTQQTMSSRFPALAQAGPVAQAHSKPATPTSLLTKQAPQQSSQSSQQIQQARQPRGPSLGYFNTDPQRPILQATNSQPPTRPPMGDAISQRSLMVAQEAQLERQQALRIQEQEAILAQAQQQAMQQQQPMQRDIQRDMQRDVQRDRQLQMKQEVETPSLNQFEPYSTPPSHANTPALTRPDAFNSVTQAEIRRTAPPQQYQPRNHQAVRSLLGDNTSGSREIKSSPSPALPRGPMSAPPASQEQYHPPPPSSLPPAAPPRQPEPVSKRSNIMSLLNDPEPSEPTRSNPPKRLSDVAANTLQTTQTPPPQHSLQSRYASQPAQPLPQPSQPMHQQSQSHIGQQHQQQSQTHSYAQPPQHSIHQHSSSIGLSRSYTPNSFETRSYGPLPPSMQQQQQQQSQMYSQAPRVSMTSQAPQIRREPSHGELHSLAGGYARTSMPPQSSSRLKESPYSASPTASLPQAGRQPIASPLELAQSSERDYYSRQPPLHIQQQSTAASSPQLGPYHPQTQQAAPNHRHLAFGQTAPHVASPPTQYATQHPLHRSRQNSFDAGHRYPVTGSSAPAPSQPGYAQAPQHQAQHPGPPLGMQYQQQHPGFESRFETDRRMRDEEQYHQQRLEESRRR